MKAIAPLLGVLAACTTLGPMPATTGISAVPAGRPGGELQGAIVPSSRLSTAARGDDRNGDTLPQLAGLFEPDRLLGIPGLIVGARMFGEDSDFGFEPMLGYRTQRGALALAGVVYGTKLGAEQNGASYDATRLGGELAVDARVASLGPLAAVHVQGAVSATFLSASGTYCVEDDGDGRDCDENTPIRMVDAELSGVYTAGALTVALDLGRTPTGIFHGLRFAGTIAAGHMPRLIDGRQVWGDPYASFGITLAVGLGAAN